MACGFQSVLAGGSNSSQYGCCLHVKCERWSFTALVSQCWWCPQALHPRLPFGAPGAVMFVSPPCSSTGVGHSRSPLAGDICTLRLVVAIVASPSASSQGGFDLFLACYIGRVGTRRGGMLQGPPPAWDAPPGRPGLAAQGWSERGLCAACAHLKRQRGELGPHSLPGSCAGVRATSLLDPGLIRS